MADPTVEPKPPSRLDEVRRAGYTVHAVVGLLLTGITPVGVAKALKGGLLGPLQAIDLADIFLLTLPLALATGLIAAMITNRIQAHLMVYITIAAVALAVCSFWADSMGYGAGVNVDPVKDPREWLFRMLRDYMTVYGEATFVCSLLVGSYAGWAVAHLVRD